MAGSSSLLAAVLKEGHIYFSALTCAYIPGHSQITSPVGLNLRHRLL